MEEEESVVDEFGMVEVSSEGGLGDTNNELAVYLAAKLLSARQSSCPVGNTGKRGVILVGDNGGEPVGDSFALAVPYRKLGLGSL